ncbi:MAG: hypothetical protein ACM3N4_12135 [Nitrososphaerota archaeon]
MVRNLYRCYLYAVCITLLIIATTTTAVSLALLLSNAGLRGAFDSALYNRQVVQAEVAFVTAWLVALLLGGLHYWLIRRDMASDPAAAGGAARSYFLNITQLFAVLIAAGFAASGIVAFGQRYGAPARGVSVALAFGGLFALLQWERMRIRVQTNAARAFQRLHLYGAQLVLVFIATPLWLQATQTSALAAMSRRAIFDPCSPYYGYDSGTVACTPASAYPLRLVAGQWAAALFIAACWAGYTVYSRNDRHSRLRQVTHLLALGYALGFVLWSAQRIFSALLLQLAGQPVLTRSFPITAAITLGALVFGVVVLLAYSWLYAREAPGLPSGVPAAGLIQMALIAVISSYPFWLGGQSLLSGIIERVVPAGASPDTFAFAQAGGQVLAGLPFVVFTLLLGTRTRQAGVTWPHRVFVLIQLAASVIVSAVGMVIGLQALGSTLLGAPLDGWQHTARTGLVTLVVGGVMVAIFLTIAARNHYLGARVEPKPDAPLPNPAVGGAPVAPETLEGILDALLAGRLSREEAAAHIRAQEALH